MNKGIAIFIVIMFAIFMTGLTIESVVRHSEGCIAFCYGEN